MQKVMKHMGRQVMIGGVLLAAQAGPPAWAAKLAFVTSVSGTGNFSTWPEAGGNTGVAAADAICVARATAANLPDPGQFVAWVSGSSGDAYCRIHGFTGTKASKCGQATLPTGAGPWQRVDGMPFMTTADQVGANGAVYMPLNIDEFGGVQTSKKILTGSNAEGTADPRTCSNWTGQDFGSIGNTARTWQGWSQINGFVFCTSSVDNRIACLQKGAGPALPVLPQRARKQAFLTSQGFQGNLSAAPQAGGNTGLAAADAICRNLAQSANLEQPQSFKAYLTTDNGNPASRFQFNGPWARLDGVPFADSFAQIDAGYVHAPLNQTQTGAYVSGTLFAWTGKGPGGESCAGWTSTGGSGWMSGVDAIGPNWPTPYFSAGTCANTYALYCLADSEMIFRGAFQ